jgi:hypothetical protein
VHRRKEVSRGYATEPKDALFKGGTMLVLEGLGADLSFEGLGVIVVIREGLS